jgi:predicted methyltransferase
MTRRLLVAGLLAVAVARAGEPATPTPAPSPAARQPFKATSTHPFDDVTHWQSVFDDPARDAWQRPAEVVAALGLRPGMAVADLGAGTGYFLRYLAPAVGPTGIVFAVETEPNLVAHLRTRAEREKLANVAPVLASFDNPRLPPRGLDVILIVDTYHHLDDRLPYLRHLKELLKPGGRVAVIDWQAGKLPVGPPADHKLAREEVIPEMTAAGYVLAEEPRVLPHQYFLIFTPAASR